MTPEYSKITLPNLDSDVLYELPDFSCPDDAHDDDNCEGCGFCDDSDIEEW